MLFRLLFSKESLSSEQTSTLLDFLINVIHTINEHPKHSIQTVYSLPFNAEFFAPEVNGSCYESQGLPGESREPFQ